MQDYLIKSPENKLTEETEPLEVKTVSSVDVGVDTVGWMRLTFRYFNATSAKS